MSNNIYRTCIVKDKNALFHCWKEKSWVVPASPRIGGTPAGQMRMTIGLIEFEDGTMHECYPEEIKFTDNYKYKQHKMPNNMKIIIEHSNTKREINGPFNICGSEESFRLIIDYLDKELKGGLSYGWVNILSGQKSIVNTAPILWDN